MKTATPTPVLTAQQVRENFRARGVTIRAFARQHGVSYKTVMNVLSGRAQCRYGNSHRIAILLGLKAPPPDDGPTRAAA